MMCRYYFFLKIAVTALVTGTFSLFQAIEQFIISTILGVLIGAIIDSLSLEYV